MLGSLDQTTVLALAFALTLTAIVGLGVSFVSGPGERRYNRRLREVASRKVGVTPATAAAARSLSRRESKTPTMDRLARWLPRRQALLHRLQRTGRSISIGQYSLTTLILMAAVTVVLLLTLRLGAGTSVLLGILAGVALPYLVIGRMGKRRVARFIALFPDAIDLMVRALRSGLPISEAVINASQEIADPVGAEFRSVEAGMRLGRELDTLLWDIARRIDAPEYKFFIIALTVQRETGGNLAETLANLADMLRRRRLMRQKARAMASEARASTMILGSLPEVVSGVLMMTSPSYIMTLIDDPRGNILLVVAGCMLATGIGIMVKMAKFDI